MEKLRKMLTLNGRDSTWHWILAIIACAELASSKTNISFSCAEK
jgi:hypothetical protein